MERWLSGWVGGAMAVRMGWWSDGCQVSVVGGSTGNPCQLWSKRRSAPVNKPAVNKPSKPFGDSASFIQLMWTHLYAEGACVRCDHS